MIFLGIIFPRMFRFLGMYDSMNQTLTKYNIVVIAKTNSKENCIFRYWIQPNQSSVNNSAVPLRTGKKNRHYMINKIDLIKHNNALVHQLPENACATNPNPILHLWNWHLSSFCYPPLPHQCYFLHPGWSEFMNELKFLTTLFITSRITKSHPFVESSYGDRELEAGLRQQQRVVTVAASMQRL